LNLVITKKTIQKYVCPKCGAKSGESCGHRKDKSRSHHARMQLAQKKEIELFYRRSKMSTHTIKANRRHPDADRQRIQVGHITFEYSTKNKTFALKACEAEHAKDRKPLFTGFIEKGMHKELLRLANVFRRIEEQKDE